MFGKLATALPDQSGSGRLETPPWLLLVALLLGYLVATGGVTALVVSLAVLASVFIVRDFRVGVVLLILLFPISASQDMPRSIGGITGLNPLNLLLLATLGSLILSGCSGDLIKRIAPRTLLLCFVAPIVLAGLLGSRQIGQIPDVFFDTGIIEFSGTSSYLRDQLIKPMFLVLFAVLVAAAATRTRRIEAFILPMLFAVGLMTLMTLNIFITSGASIGDLAGEGARRFLSPMGMHANDLGRLYAIAYALMLFTFASTPRPVLRFALLASMAALVVALILTFSRSAFIGFALVNVWFVLTRRSPVMLLLAALALAGLLALLPDAVFQRLGTGSESGVNAISAGRVDMIWLPLLPELSNSPLIGNGLMSTVWSEPMRAGRMLLVTHPHNAYLQALLDLGLFGSALLCLFYLHVWRGFRQLATDPAGDPTVRGFFTGATVGLAVFLVTGFSGSSLMPVLEQVFLWLAIGMMFGYRHVLSEAGTLNPSTDRNRA